jgi:hypothetical protein
MSEDFVFPAFEHFGDVLAAHSEEIGRVIVNSISNEAPVDTSPEPSRPPGTLRDSFSFDAEAGADSLVINVMTSDAPVIDFVRFGTAAHVITAVNTKALRFMTRDGAVHFAHQVQHPGTAPNEFVLRADDAIQTDIAPLIEDAMREVLA